MELQRNVVGVTFILLCLQGVGVDSSNLTTTLAVDSGAKNMTLVGIKLKLTKHKTHLSDEDEPLTDVEAEIAEGARVYDKWETGDRLLCCYYVYFVIDHFSDRVMRMR